MSGHVFHQHFLFAAEASADARLDHADSLHGQSQNWCEHSSYVEWHLRGCANHETIIFIPISDTYMRLDMCLLNFWYFIFSFENFVGFGETFFNIADVNADFSGEILFGIRICKVDKLRLIVNLSRTGHGFPRIQDHRQNFIFNVNES